MTIASIGNQGGLPPAPAAPQGAAAPPVPSAVAAPDPPPQPQPKPEQVRSAVAAMNRLVEVKAPNSLQFVIDDSTGRTIVRVTDAQTGDLIRQIPPEEILAITRSLDKRLGMLLQGEA